jgi:hypothetical protein
MLMSCTITSNKVYANVTNWTFARPIVPHPHLVEPLAIQWIDFEEPQHQTLETVA